MTTLIHEVYDAFRSIGIDETKAKDAAAAITAQGDRLAKIEGNLSMLKWMIGTVGGLNLTMSLLILGKLLLTGGHG